MQLKTYLSRAVKAPKPLAPRELVTDDTLRLLARGEPDWQRGDISDGMRAMLVMALPDICGELLARRAAMLHDASRTQPLDHPRRLPFPRARNHAEHIANVRASLEPRHAAFGPLIGE